MILVQMDDLISAKRPDIIINKKKKKRTCTVVDFAIPVDYRIVMVKGRVE